MNDTSTDSATSSATTQSTTGSYTETQAFQLIEQILKDRKSERRWRMFWRTFIVGLLCLMVYSCVSGLSNTVNDLDHFKRDDIATIFNGPSKPHIAVVSLKGVIAEGATDASQIAKLLKKAFKNEYSEAVFIDANSPGGSPVQSALIHDAIKRLKAKYDKPIYAIATDVCASGCYYAVAGVDKIIVHPSSIIGSIGVRLESFDMRKLMEKIGVKQRLLVAGENKALLNPFGEVNKKEEQYLQQLIEKTHQEFIDVVLAGRQGKISAEDENLFSGLIWTGRESITLGLADGLGDLQTVAKSLNQENLKYYDTPFDFVDKFVDKIMLQLINNPQFASNQTLQSKY